MNFKSISKLDLSQLIKNCFAFERITRETWTSPSSRIKWVNQNDKLLTRLIFVLGKTNNTKEIQEEATLYNDILQG